MKHSLYILTFFLFHFGFANAAVSEPVSSTFLPPTATVTASATSVCQNSGPVTITFTGSGGTAPYTFVYNVNGGTNQSISTTGGNSTVTIQLSTNITGVFNYQMVSVASGGAPVPENDDVTVTVNPPIVVDFTYNTTPVCSGSPIAFNSTVSGGSGSYSYSWDFDDGSNSNSADPTHVFNITGCGNATFNVVLTVTSGGCMTTRNYNVVVKRTPHVAIEDVNIFWPFSNCDNNPSASNPNYSLTVNNISGNASCTTSYDINWGDGAVTTGVTFPATHTYTELGAFQLTVTAHGQNGCTNIRTYAVANQSNPAGGLGTLGETTGLCTPATVPFTISNWELNSPGTTYVLNFGDGESVTLTHPLSSSVIEHTYTTSSCPQPTFTATLDVINLCDTTPYTAGNIQIRIEPQGSFTGPLTACVGQNVCFTSNSTMGSSGPGCSPLAIYTWDFGDPAGVGNVISGNGTSIPNGCHVFSSAGTYTVSLTVSNPCGQTTFTQQICIETPLVPQFTLSQNNGCTPMTVTATSTTNFANSCTPPNYLWAVTYASANCGTSPATWTYAGGTSETSANPIFNFVTAGTYSISLTTSNSCGTVTSPPQTIVVKRPPTVTINNILDACGSASINPSANINNCAPTGEAMTYAWSFPGGSPPASSAMNPGTILYSAPGNYTVTLVVTNSCGSTTASEDFTINVAPTITNTSLSQAICSGQQTTAVPITATPAGTTFTWTATATPGITVTVLSGNTSTIPPQTITTSNTTSGTVTYEIVPTLNGCAGTPVNYVITVHPAPQINVHPAPAAACQNAVLSPLTVGYVNGTGSPTYQWYSNTTPINSGGTAIPGATAQTYTPPSSTIGTVYYYVIISLPSGGCSNLSSNTAAVTVAETPSITTQPMAFQSICVGGSATPFSLAYSGGTGTATYQWYSNTTASNSGGTVIPGATLSSYTPPAFNTIGSYYFYAVVTLSGNGCGIATSAFAEVEVVADPVIDAPPLASQTLCSSATSAPLVVAASGGAGTLSYQWYSNGTNSNSGGTLIAGEISATFVPPTDVVGTLYYYAIITTAASGCSVTSATSAVTVNASPTFTVQPLPAVVCQGGSFAPLSVTYINGTGTPSYQWYSNVDDYTSTRIAIAGETSPNYTPSAAIVGIQYYYVVITLPPSAGCSSLTSNTAEIEVTPGTTISTEPLASQSLCIGGTIPSALTVAYTGGTGTPSYQWYSNTTSNNSGGTILPGATASSYTPPAYTTAGTYYYYAVVSLSGNGCGPAASQVAEVIVSPDPTVSVQPVASQTLCQSAAPETLTVVASGGVGTYSYQWFSNTINSTTGGTPIAGATSDSYVPDTSVVGTMYYFVLITQSGSGCAVTSGVAQVLINLAPSIDQQPASETVCLGASLSQLTVNYINGTGTPTYQWYSNNTNDTSTGVAISGENGPTFTPPATAVGTTFYYVIITLPSTGGCSAIVSDAAEIVINPLPTISSQPLTSQSICEGGNIPTSLSVDYQGGAGTASYQWYSNTTNANTGGTIIPGATASTYMPSVFTAAGNYYYYAVVTLSGNGCSSATSDPATVIVVIDPVIGTQPIPTQEICQDALPQDLTVAVSGGAGTSYFYQWFQNTVDSTVGGIAITGANAATYTPSATFVGTTYYYVVVSQATDAGCSVTSSTSAVIVNAAAAIVNQPTSNIVCIGTPIELLVSYSNGAGTPIYQWYSNTVNSTIGASPISGETSNQYTPSTSTAGTMYYYVVISFPSVGCGDLVSNIAELTINANPVIASSAEVICSGNSFTVVPDESTGNIVPIGTTYTWSMPVINPPGSITGASAETIQQSQISQNLVNSTPGVATVTYTVVPISGTCLGAEFTITVTVNPSISPNVTLSNSTCYNASNGSITTNITGGIPFPTVPYQITWTGPGTFTSSAPSIFGLAPGTYTLTINDAGGCPFTSTYTITEPDEIIITVDLENDITCFGDSDGAISISVTGGTLPYQYTWTKNTQLYSNAEDISDLGPGAYTISVTDVNGCGPATSAFTITEPPLLTLNLASQTNVLCYGYATGAISVNVGGGTQIEVSPGIFGYNFAWTGPGGFTSSAQNLTDLMAGTYNLVVSDLNGCTQNLSVTLTQTAEILITAVTTPITCYGDDNASIALTVTGGVAPYQATWSNLATGLFQDNLAAGTYTITITDALGCPKPITVVIPQAPVFMVDPIVQQISCSGANDGSINLNLTGGIAPVTMTWTDGSTAGLIRNNLGPGTYTATISDGTPCHITRTFIIVEPQPLVISATTVDAFDCEDANSGSINLTVAGGTGPYSFAWSNGATTEDLVSITSGNYVVTVTDARGCTKTAQFTITRPAAIAIVMNVDTIADCSNGFVEQIFTAQVSGGVAPFTYTWSSGTISGANDEIMTSSQNTTVVFEATDSRGCTASYTFDVVIPIIDDAGFSTSSIGFETYGIYSIIDPIQFTNGAQGDFTAISWNFGDGAFSTEENPVHSYVAEGDYVITQTVTYPHGCVYTHVITLTIKKGYFLVVPDAFTPNDDTLNDTFRPLAKGLDNVKLSVYDTWGSLIYSEQGTVLHGWDGKIKGVPAENGNYYCKVTAQTFYNTTVEVSHPFVLIN